jgi:hypothetical protein
MIERPDDSIALREAVIATARAMNTSGINVNKSGNVSVRCHRGGRPGFLLTPTGVPYANLDGVTGLTVPVGDAQAFGGALKRILSDDVFRARLGRQAKERALTQFTIERMVRNTVTVYREAIEMHAEKRGGKR